MDLVTNEFVKCTASVILTFYTNLFDAILDNGEVPEAWTTGIIVPIYKRKGETTDPNNYRGITLVSVLGKVFTKLINTRIDTFLNSNSILLDNQAGFRKNMSTADQVFVLQNLIDVFLKKGKKLFVAWVDYEKAFDKVWRQGLFHKMLKEGISSKIVDIVKAI